MNLFNQKYDFAQDLKSFVYLDKVSFAQFYCR